MLYKAKKYFVSALNEVFLVGTLIDSEFYDKLNPNEQSYFELFNEREEGMDLIGGVCRPALEETNGSDCIPCLPRPDPADYSMGAWANGSDETYSASLAAYEKAK